MKTYHHTSSWFLALASALFLALGPALAPVLSAGPPGRTIEICTVFGLVKQVVSGEETPAPEHGKAGVHCLLCQGRQFALLPPSITVAAPFAGNFIPAVFTETAVAGLPAGLPYESRAPPSLS